MGVYDIYNGIHLKAGECCMAEYKLGAHVDIPDGVYLTFDGAVVIENGKLVIATNKVFCKRGFPLNLDKLI